MNETLVLSVVRFGLSVAEWLGWKKPFCSQSSIAFVESPPICPSIAQDGGRCVRSQFLFFRRSLRWLPKMPV